MQVLRRHVQDAEDAGVGQLEAEHQLAAVFGLALDRQRHLELVFGNIVGGDLDLDIDRWLLLLRGQRGRRIRILEREVLGILRQNVQLRSRSSFGRRAIAVGHDSLSCSVRSAASLGSIDPPPARVSCRGEWLSWRNGPPQGRTPNRTQTGGHNSRARPSRAKKLNY